MTVEETHRLSDSALIKYSTLVGAAVKNRPGPIPHSVLLVFPAGQLMLYVVVADSYFQLVGYSRIIPIDTNRCQNLTQQGLRVSVWNEQRDDGIFGSKPQHCKRQESLEDHYVLVSSVYMVVEHKKKKNIWQAPDYLRCGILH